MHAGDLADTVHDFLEVFQVGDFQDYVYAGLAVLAASFYVADVGVGVADEGGDLFEHTEAIIAEKRDFDGIRNRLAVFLAGPEHVDAAVGVVEKIGDVRTVDGVDGNAFAASDVAHDGLAANGVATLGTINEKVAGPSDYDGVAVSAEDSAHDARNTARETAGCRLLFSVGHRFSAGGREFRQHLAGRVLAISDAGHKIVGAAKSVFAGRSLQIGFLDFLQRDAVFARFFFDQLFSDFNGALALMDIEPVP